MQFDIPLTLLQFLLPAVCAGLLLSGMALFLYMSRSYHSKVYGQVALLAFFALGFVGSEVFLLSFGSYKHIWKVAIHFHQTEQIFGAFFLYGMPAFLGTLLDLGPSWQKRNRILSYIGLAFAFISIVVVFTYPDLFISSTERKITWNKYEGDFGRGKEGVLYFIRDGMMTVYAIYCFISIRLDIKKNKEYKYLLFPLAGIIFAILGGIIDTGFVYTGYHFDFLPHIYFSRFSLGITLLVILMMAGLMRHFIDVSKEVERAHKLISISEEKYRVLVEGTNDLIFTLDDTLNFISANRASVKQFGLSEDDLQHKSFLDMIHIEEGSKGVELELVMQKISDLDRKKRPATFKAVLVGSTNVEPKEYEVRLERIQIAGKNEIIGKAAILSDNTLMKYLAAETQCYELDNYLITAEEVSKRLVANLGKHMAPSEITPLRIGIREIIINAIEHGNLNITFDEKTNATCGNQYMEFIASRQKDPVYRDRRVTVKFTMDTERVIYVIEDEGNGFNYREALERAQEANAEELAHGRGLIMAMGIFDKIKFNDKGNKVQLLRKFRKTEI
jgi:two-component system, sensor histidine kinase LadS